MTYTIARDCGHFTRQAEFAPAEIEWCESCGTYVGLIVLNTEPRCTCFEAGRNPECIYHGSFAGLRQ